MIPMVSRQLTAANRGKIVDLDNQAASKPNLKSVIEWCQLRIDNPPDWQKNFWARYPNMRKEPRSDEVPCTWEWTI